MVLIRGALVPLTNGGSIGERLGVVGLGGTAVGKGVSVAVGRGVGVEVTVGVGVGVRVAVAVGVDVGVSVGRLVAVGVEEGLGDGVGVTVGETVSVGVSTGVAASVAVLVAVGGIGSAVSSTKRYVGPPMMQPRYSSAQRAPGRVSAYSPPSASRARSAPV